MGVAATLPELSECTISIEMIKHHSNNEQTLVQRIV